MQPTIGRIVHYQSYGTPGGEYLPEPRAAVITEVQYVVDNEAMDQIEGTYEYSSGGTGRFVQHIAGVETSTPISELPQKALVGLCILNPTGMFFNTSVPFADEPTPGHWNWPPRS